MFRGIRLSNKHGVNPSVGLCYFCGKAKDVLLFGRMQDDAEAPHECIHDTEPCDVCKEHMKEGVFFMEARPGEGTDRPRPTGRLVCLKEKAAGELISNPEIRDRILKSRVCLLEPETFEKV